MLEKPPTMASEATAAIISNPLMAPLPLSHQQAEQQQQPLPPPAKKKRSLPGTPDPDAEVIALSPRTLMATNRFVCEICGKGFQRDQNLQLHRRGHNLPWKLRQRSGKEPPRKRVYVCPETSCVHHNPSRALGDLTGIKKHFCRKHGEKKWKCDKCSKKYAVQSDWKAHAKTCGTREYRCDCGTLFSRRDSFITHRAFCDALAEETARLNAAAAPSSYHFAAGSPPGLAAVRPNMVLPAPPHLKLWGGSDTATLPSMGIIGGVLAGAGAPPPVVPPQLYAELLPVPGAPSSQQLDAAQLGWLYGGSTGKQLSSSNASDLTTTEAPSVFSGQHHGNAKPAPPTDMSATALLQKAAQMGAVQASGNAMSAAEDVFRASSQLQHAANLTGGNVAYDILSAAGLNKDAAVHVGREETRDFLGVGVQALCSSSLPLHGWIA
ncbi:hypothetical protein SEVIR_5G002300v4 [Setaria viridis]|uniref:Protein EARLY HEADING DATE 2 n=3 Tax=Setaria TaxID=4554 RepID=A0A368QZL1_SETIT|nr:zinc finger protein MAGPIE [Setaria italica]XP_034593614.1 zinc finger protein MAGPIE-like [Setaria viridis]RCV23391.1 hypothetical protein SETIT_5G002400v2 [Setaria italica]TKW11899.1 hypothetical protein SEVIR_5G002300v2 [Setaria viridis]